MRSRPQPVTVAAILLALSSLVSLLSLPFPLLAGAEEVPAVVVYGGVALSIVGLVATVGLWRLKEWGLWLTIVVSVLNLLSAAPGLVLAFGPVLKTITLVAVVVPALITVLVLLPSSRRAFRRRLSFR